jgi:nitronate monooxygenase
MDPYLKVEALGLIRNGSPNIFTDPSASPTGFPFKVFSMDGTLSQPEVYDRRVRVCDLGYLRELYRKEDGTVGYRCPGEPLEDFLKKGGEESKTIGRKCICNGLLATAGAPQTRKTGYQEPPIVTAGESWSEIRPLLEGRASYSAKDVLDLALR